MLRRFVKRWAVKYRAFMRAEIPDEADHSAEMSLARAMEAALLTIALHTEDHGNPGNPAG